MNPATSVSAKLIGKPNTKKIGANQGLSDSLIYSLTLCILLVIAPHTSHLPTWVSILCVILLSWRAYLTYRKALLPPRWIVFVVTIGGVIAIATGFHAMFGREVGITFLMLLATLKLMELRAPRDATSLIHLSCFMLLTDFFYTQSILTALLMIVTLIAIVSTWLRIQVPHIKLRPQLRIAGLLLSQSVPLMLILFILFPRVPGPLWGLPQDAYNSSGLTDSMSPGSLSKLSLSEAVAFRVTYKNIVPPHDQMYWRGPVLWLFDGKIWRTGRPDVESPPTLVWLGNAVDYSVTLEPHNRRWLYALDMPGQIPAGAHLNSDFDLMTDAPVNTRMRYLMSSHLVYHADAQESSAQLQRALQLPPDLNPRTLDLAGSWRKSNSNDVDVVKAALSYFNQNNFIYTLEPPLLGKNGIDDFLFRTRKGFCEHYASAFVYLMRAANIPARVVTGYQGGEFNAIGNYYIVRQSDAHAWGEVWLKGRGWVRVDPTAAIAPARIEQSLAAAVKDDTLLPFMERNPPLWLSQIRMNLDAVTNQWNQWVLGYDPERQFALLTRIGMDNVSWQKMARDMLLALAITIGLLALIMFRHALSRNIDPVQSTWIALCQRLEHAGLPRKPHEGALDFADRVSTARPELADAILHVARLYIALRYGRSHSPESLRTFKVAAHSFKL